MAPTRSSIWACVVKSSLALSVVTVRSISRVSGDGGRSLLVRTFVSFDHLGFGADSLGPPVVERQGWRGRDGRDVLVQAPGEGVQDGQVGLAGMLFGC